MYYIKNLEKKLNTYLKQFDREDVEGILTFDVEENKKWLFNGTLKIKIDGKSFYTLVTGHPDALQDLYFLLPKIIQKIGNYNF